MKKYISGFMALTLCLLILSACGSEPAQGADNDFPDFGGGLQLVTGISGPLLYAAAPSGLYEVIPHDSGRGLLAYTDYASKTRVVLCSAPNCRHEDDTCPAYLSSVGYIFMNADNSKLFCMQNALAGYTEKAQIVMMNPDGSDRTVLCSFSANEMFLDAVAANADYIFFAIRDVQTADSEPMKKMLAVNIHTKEVVSLGEYTNTTWLTGAYDDNLIIRYYDSALLSDETVFAAPQTGDMVYTAFSLSTFERREFYRFASDDSGSYATSTRSQCHKDQLYILSQYAEEKAELIRVDIKSGQETLLSRDVPFFHIDTTFIEGFLDDYLIVHATDTRAAQIDFNNPIIFNQLAVNCKTGEILQLTLTIPYYEMDSFLPVLASFENHYLVISGYEFRNVTMYGNDGTPYTVEVDDATYSLIAKEDYWSNTPNFIPINDLAYNY